MAFGFAPASMHGKLAAWTTKITMAQPAAVAGFADAYKSLP
jgi:hypothetical protein